MREIKFRVWNDYTNEMRYTFKGFTNEFDVLNLTKFFNEENYLTLLQFIGIRDVKGREIFQKDICKYYNDSDKDGVGIIEDDYIKWISGTIAKTNLMTPLYYLKCGSDFEVLGNVYENPELLEQGRVVTQESEPMSL